jgi:hypothetical protein
VLYGRSTCVSTTTKRLREHLAEQHGPAQPADAALLSHSCFSSSRLVSVCARRRTLSAFRLDLPAPLVLPAHQWRVSCRLRRETCPALAAVVLVRRYSLAAAASRSLSLDRHLRRVAATEPRHLPLGTIRNRRASCTHAPAGRGRGHGLVPAAVGDGQPRRGQRGPPLHHGHVGRLGLARGRGQCGPRGGPGGHGGEAGRLSSRVRTQRAGRPRRGEAHRHRAGRAHPPCAHQGLAVPLQPPSCVRRLAAVARSRRPPIGSGSGAHQAWTSNVPPSWPAPQETRVARAASGRHYGLPLVHGALQAARLHASRRHRRAAAARLGQGHARRRALQGPAVHVRV